MWTSDDLILELDDKTFVPSRSNTLSSTAKLRFASSILKNVIVPQMMNGNGGFFETTAVIPLTGTDTYPIPSRAIGGRVESIWLVWGDGSETPIYAAGREELDAWKVSTDTTSDYCVATIQGYSILLNPIPNSAVSMRILYCARPGDLILQASAQPVATVNAGSLVLDGALTGLSTGTKFDIIQANPGFTTLGADQTATVAGATLTFTPPSGVAVDDWVCLAGYSPVPQIPPELHPYLVELTAARVLKAIGDYRGAQDCLEEAARMKEELYSLISPRVAETEEIIVNALGVRPFGAIGGPGGWGYRR